MTDRPERRAAPLTEDQRQKNLMRWLDWRWRDDYVVFSGDGEYSATRIDNFQALTAGSPDELKEKIAADYTAQPVVRQAVADED